MPDKKIGLPAAFILIAAALGLSAVLPEAEFMHTPFHVVVLAVVILSFYMPIKDVMILVFITAGVAIGMTQMNIFEQLNQLILETGVLVAVTMVLGWYESIYKEEHHKKSLVCNYKKEEIEELRKKIAVLNADNHEISEKTRDIRKSFV